MKENSSPQKRSDSTWMLFSFRIPPDTKAIIERMAYGGGLTQSELVRSAIDEFLVSHSTDEWERKAAEVAAQRRKETVKLAQAKDSYKTEMQISSAWDTILNSREKFSQMGVLGRYHYATWIDRLEQNIVSLESSNPDKDMATKTYQKLIEKLKGERDERFPKEE